MKQPLPAVFRPFSPGPLYNAESRRILSTAALLVAVGWLIISGCASQPPLAGPWTIALESSGGLAGRGAGSYVLTSEGSLTIRTPDGVSCSVLVPADDVARIGAILSDATTRRWADDYVPEETCCDRFHYALTADTARGTFATRWIDAPEPMPRALFDLAVALGPWGGRPESLARRYAAHCPDR